MKKISIFKYAFALLSSVFSLAISLMYFIKSYEINADEYGTDISFNNDYLIALMISVIFVFWLLYLFINEIKATKVESHSEVILSSSSLILGAYNLGVFFKALFEALSKNKAFNYLSHQYYLYLGILFSLIFITFLLKLFEKKQKQN